jgi:hypothetical protein
MAIKKLFFLIVPFDMVVADLIKFGILINTTRNKNPPTKRKGDKNLDNVFT